MSPRYVETNGLRLHYLEHEGDGPTLVLTHGLSANAHFFDGLVAAGLAPALRVLSFDLRGRGLSDKPDAGYRMEDHAADLLGALDALGLDRVALGGHSFGGLLTMFVAAHAPERVERAVVFDAPAEVDATVIDQIAPSLARLDRTFPSAESYVDAMRALPYFADGGFDDLLGAYFRDELEEADGGGVRPRVRAAHMQQAIEATLEPDWPALAARIACPTLLVRTTGAFGPPGAGPILTPDAAARTIALLRDGRLVETGGNHITAAFGVHARGVADAVVSFVRA